MKTYSLRCKSCGGVLDISKDREVFFCPYCGSKELVDVSDEVRIERIRSETKRGIEQDKNETRRGMLTDLYDARQRRRQQKIEKKQKELENEQKEMKFSVYVILGIALLMYVFYKMMSLA